MSGDHYDRAYEVPPEVLQVCEMCLEDNSGRGVVAWQHSMETDIVWCPASHVSCRGGEPLRVPRTCPMETEMAIIGLA